MDAAYRQFRDRKIFGSLDGLRAAAILAVVWHHTGGAAASVPLATHGFLGVDLFFVLSGFLIVTLLLREREATGRISLGKFYIRRSLRIFPVYYALLAGIALTLGLLRPDAAWAEPFFAKLPYYLTYTANWLPDATLLAIAWSLAAEEQFYLVWPPLEKFVRPPVLLGVLAGFLAVNQAVNFQVLEAYWPAWLSQARGELEILQITFTPIALGVLLAHALHHPRTFAALRRVLGSPVAQVAAIAIGLIAASQPGDISGWPRLVVQLAFVGLLATCVVREDHGLSAVFGRAPLKRLGAVSYGMYLFHMFVAVAAAAAFRRLGIDSAGAAFLVVAGLTYVVAEISFRYYETPWLRLKRRFETGSDAGRLATSVAPQLPSAFARAAIGEP